MESLWMIEGRNAGRELDRYVRNFSQRYGESETGIMHGAYGHRWRQHFDVEGGSEQGRLPDQIETIVRMLRADPTSRRAVLAMWDPVADLATPHTDIPCNTHIYFRCRTERGYPVLDMTVCCRSNDLVMGMCGANAVHMSVLQEYVAALLEREVGTYTQISNNLHYYTRDEARLPADDAPVRCLYSGGVVVPTPLFNSLGEARPVFVETEALHSAWMRCEGHEMSEDVATRIVEMTAGDWRRACSEWIERRLEARARRAS
jgi:thymidylate synthase